jgi:type I restriction enzyme S subunit
MFLECKVPLPNENSTLVINYVEELVKASIFLEIEIKEKYTKILNLIKTEISGNQKLTTYNYEFPSYKEMYDAGRFDTNLFTQYFKTQEFLISNYSHGCSSIEKLDFEISRGQNLQISAIGKSIYSDMIEKNFYTLMLPNHLSKFGTINKVEYLGNRRKLKILNKGDIIFGAEGFEKGRSIVIVDDKIKTITNIHGITLHHRQGNLVLSIFIKCFLDYLRAIGLIDLYAVGGNGGSLAMKYWNVISFPNFPRVKQEEISNLYYNQNANPQKIISSKENFINNIQTYINSAGIFEMDKTLKIIKKRISEVFDQIVKDEKVETNFLFLNK